MWRAVGTDFWVVVPIQSAARAGHEMEGTRLTLVRPPNLASTNFRDLGVEMCASGLEWNAQGSIAVVFDCAIGCSYNARLSLAGMKALMFGVVFSEDGVLRAKNGFPGVVKCPKQTGSA